MTVLDYRAAPVPQAEDAQTSGHWLGWALYLAMSWTWCIGMFLPVLLVRDYGAWGWLVFAVPNVVGAVAMGFILRTRESSRRLVDAHRPAMIAFSAVTCAFQLFFAAWMFARFPFVMLLYLTAAIAAAIGLVSGRRKGVLEQSVAAGVAIISIGCFLASMPHLDAPLWLLRLDQAWLRDLAVLSVVSMFGFLLCPYLDLTFHNARQQCTPGDGRKAFGVGFGLIFLAVILFSLAYARPLRLLTDLRPMLLWAISIYFVVQLGFTTGVHWLELRSLGRLKIDAWLVLVAATAVLGVLCFRAAELVPEAQLIASPRRPPAETVYRGFMGFYGLVFPAYVWLCMIPSPRARPTRRSLVVFGAAVLIAAPIFWLGFIGGEMLWLWPGVAVVMLARLAVRGNPQS